MPISGSIGRVLVAVLTALLIVACGGGDSSGDPGGEGGQDQGQEDGSASGGIEDFEEPAIDPSSMPPPGEARVEVDGQTFVFKQSEMLEGPFACDIRDNGVTINFQSDRHDLLFQGAVAESGRLVISTTVSPEESDNKYGGQSSSGSGAAVAESPYVLFVGNFLSSPKNDPASISDAGVGTIAITCP